MMEVESCGEFVSTSAGSRNVTSEEKLLYETADVMPGRFFKATS
jgi:hypothetical protein